MNPQFSKGELRDVDVTVSIYVLNGVKKGDAILQWALEGFASQDQTHSTGAFVDYRCSNRLGKVVRTRCATGVNQTRAAHVTVHDLVAGQVDRVLAGQFRVDVWVCFAPTSQFTIDIATVSNGHLLLDDVGADGNTQMIRL